MESRLRSSSPSSSCRSQSPTSSPPFSPRRRMTPYLIRSHTQRFYQVGPITDTDNMCSSKDMQSPFDVSTDLKGKARPSSSASNSTIFSSMNRTTDNSAINSLYEITQGTDFGSANTPTGVASSQQPWQLSSQLLIDSENSNMQIASKPQHLKKSPFGKMERESSGTEAGSRDAGLMQQSHSPILLRESLSSSASINPSSSFISQAQFMFDKWANAFGCGDGNKTPIIIPSPLPPQNPSINDRKSLLTPTPTRVTSALSTASSSSNSGFFATRANSSLSNELDEQPINLSRPNSTFSTRHNSNEEVPLDLRSHPSSRSIRLSAARPSHFIPQPGLSRSPYDQTRTKQQDFQTEYSKFGSLAVGKLGIVSSSMISKPPPSPLATNSRSASNNPEEFSFGIENAKRMKGENGMAKATTTELLQETTEKMHCMKLRSDRSLQQQQQRSKKVVSTVRKAMTGWDASISLLRIGQSRANLHTTTSLFSSNFVGPSDNRDNRITLHYPRSAIPQQQSTQSKLDIPLQKQQQTISCPPHVKSFRGLYTKVIDGSFSDILTDKLEENYSTGRHLVLNKDGWLMTPFKFLHLLCDRMGVHFHKEIFNFYISPRNIQYRTEIYVGGFCGVGHAVSTGFSEQLAAAHVLERMRIHFSEIKQTEYALFPGTRYTKILEKLTTLCKTFDLGKVRMEYNDRQKKFNLRRGNIRRGGWNYQDFDPVRWECSCFVKSYRAVVMSDHMMYGGLLAARSMYINFAKPPEVAVVQIKDYFGIGVDCPMLKDIHASLLLNLPSIDKVMWAEKNKVPITQLDAVLHDPMNRYLMGQLAFNKRIGIPEGEFQAGRDPVLEANKLVEFRRNLVEALEWIQATCRKNSLQEVRLELIPRETNTTTVATAATTSTATIETDVGDDLVKDIMDQNDAEVEEIFHDASMDVEVELC